LVVGNAEQREPFTSDDGRTLLETYLGVSFTGNGEAFISGDSCEVTLQLDYHPEVNYDHVVPGASFTLREGGKIVGFGSVKSRIG